MEENYVGLIITLILFFISIPWNLFNWFGVSGVLGFVIFVLILYIVLKARERRKLRRTIEDILGRNEEDLKDGKKENKEWWDGYLKALDWVSREIGMSPKRAAALEEKWKETLAKMEERKVKEKEEKVKKNRLIARLYSEGKDEREIRAELLKKGFDDPYPDGPDGLDYEIRMEIARLRHEMDPKNWTAH